MDSSFRPRVFSAPSLHPSPQQYPSTHSRLFTSNPAINHLSSESTFRNRSRSPSSYRDRSPGRLRSKSGALKSPKPDAVTSPHASASTWWNNTELVPRPWRDVPRKKIAVPAEEMEGWMHTRSRVAEAAACVLGTAGDIAHETLLISVDFLRFAPIIGLEEAARTLLNIWDSLQLVDTNRRACLRLTERCAETLLSVREEIADNHVSEELNTPIAKLVESFNEVHSFLQMQVDRPFIKRYLKRDDILKQIAACDAALSDSLSKFSLSIQIRILKQVQATERNRQQDNTALLSSLSSLGITNLPSRSSHQIQSRRQSESHAHAHFLSSTDPHLETRQHSAYADHDPADPTLVTLPGLPPSSSHPSTSVPTPSPRHSLNRTQSKASTIHAALLKLHRFQNTLDQAHDIEDLRQIMRAALQTSSDADMLAVLQVGREEMPEAMKALQRGLENAWEKGLSSNSWGVTMGGTTPELSRRSRTIVGYSPGVGGTLGSGGDTLDKEFMESGIDALRRMSKGVEINLPSWTITRYEVDRHAKIGIGFFSDVYRGTWGDRAVAVKVLAPATPRPVFMREVAIWKELRHGHVLELFGASGAAGDGPWFLVSPYLKKGSVVKYLKELKGEGREGEVDLLKIMHEVAKGMEYLHGKGVLHGDLKAANVLVDDTIHCVISDFGQSEMKSEVYRISGTPLPHGTLRWQAPELMAGQNQLTAEIDVYAYAICCVEILTMGNLPWPLMDDDAVRYFVLKENTRPILPATRTNTPQLQELLRVCWHWDPSVRPTFGRIVRDVKRLRINAGPHARVDDTTSPRMEHVSRPSPDMLPIGLPQESRHLVPGPEPSSDSPTLSNRSYRTAPCVPPSPMENQYIPAQTPQPVLYTPSLSSSRASSLFTAASEDKRVDIWEHDEYESPPPVNERMAELRNERQYRQLLTHDFHPSLTLPLWTPVNVDLGAVGYLSKSSGMFVTLFNSFNPSETSGGLAKGICMPSVQGYGRVTKGSQRQDRRNIGRRGLDTIVGLLTFRNKGDGAVSQNVCRRYSFPLRSGHRAAYLCTETTTYQYTENLDAPKKWFKANIDAIMQAYGPYHPIQKEDIFLVIGTLDASEYGLFVSHQHPDGQAHFNVFSSPKAGKSWGAFTTDTKFPAELGGPFYHEELPGNPLSASKVSCAGNSSTVLVARLRFKPDVLEPTSL